MAELVAVDSPDRLERDHEGLGFQLEYARRLSHVTLPHPDITT